MNEGKNKMQLNAEIYAWHQNFCEDGARPL